MVNSNDEFDEDYEGYNPAAWGEPDHIVAILRPEAGKRALYLSNESFKGMAVFTRDKTKAFLIPEQLAEQYAFIVGDALAAHTVVRYFVTPENRGNYAAFDKDADKPPSPIVSKSQS